MSRPHGYDLSRANRVRTRDELHALGARFVFAKASGGVHADPKFAGHMLSATGLERGAYAWISEADPINAQIEAYLSAVAPMGGVLVAAVDCEPVKGVLFAEPRRMAAMVFAFLEELVEPLLYASPAVLAQFTSAERERFASVSSLWIAHYGVEMPQCPAEWTEGYTVWQTGTEAGIDRDELRDEATFAALFGGAP